MGQYRFNDVVKNFKNLLLFFNVPEKEVDITTPSQFFTLIHKFATNCLNSLKALKEQEEKSKKGTTIRINKKSVNYGQSPLNSNSNSESSADNQSPRIVKQVSTDLRSRDIRKNITIGGEYSKGLIDNLKHFSSQSPSPQGEEKKKEENKEDNKENKEDNKESKEDNKEENTKQKSS